jgi:uroporphyrinogen decarboxylase
VTHRERIVSTFRFERVDRPAVDLMEGHVWTDLAEHFRRRGVESAQRVIEALDPDCRWVRLRYVGPPPPEPKVDRPLVMPRAATRDVRDGPLSSASTVREVEAYQRPDPAWHEPPDLAEFASQFPDHARVLFPGWAPMFWGACEAFGLEEALVKACTQPAVFEAYLDGQHEWYMRVLTRAVRAARGYCDICWLGDDYAGQASMLLSPEMWRRFIRPRLAEQVRLIRENGMWAMLHSCGAVRPILPDLIDIGMNALLVFQTTAAGMDATSIARDFGGRMVFYGGIDVQHLLSYGSRAEVEEAVRGNVSAFAACGGYVVANSHHGVSTISGDNVAAMFQIAKAIHLGRTDP